MSTALPVTSFMIVVTTVPTVTLPMPDRSARTRCRPVPALFRMALVSCNRSNPLIRLIRGPP